MEVAAGAGLNPVAAYLHVPEEGLAQPDRGSLVGHELREVGRLRDWHRLERRQLVGRRRLRRSRAEATQHDYESGQHGRSTERRT